MLTKDDIILGQLIAEGLPANSLIKPSGVLAGLNEVSFAVSPYSANGFVDQVEEVTQNLTPHSEIMELATTEMAKVIRGAFDMVKTYGVPMALSIADGVSCLYSQESLRRTVRNEFDARYVNVDDPLFNFNVYPVPGSVTLKGSTFTSVNLDILGRLKFDYMPDEAIQTWLKNNHPEVNAIINDKGVDNVAALYNLTRLDGLNEVFNVSGENTFDFTKIKTVDILRLMKMFVIASKMLQDTKPIPSLIEGSLEDYRSYVEQIWNGLVHYLVKFKEFNAMYRAREIAVVDLGPVRYKEITPHEALGVKVKVVEAKVLVFYTEAIMKAMTVSEVAISDVVLGYLYARLIGHNVSLKELANDKLKTSSLISSYVSEVSGLITRAAQQVFCESAAIAIARFIEQHPAAKEALYRSTGETGSLVPTVIREKLGTAINNLYTHYSAQMAEDTGESYGVIDVSEESSPIVGERKKRCIEIILSTDIVPIFLNLLGCDMAASIIAATYVAQEKAFTAVDEREKLHCALIKVLANVSLG